MMRWYKHFSNAHRDTKIKKLINDFGSDGYAVYFYCLELIAEAIDSDNIKFELEDDSELVGQYLHIDTLRVEKIMKKAVDLCLFEVTDDKVISCIKMAKFLDERFTRSKPLKDLIKSDKMQDIKKRLSSDKDKTSGDNAPQKRIEQQSIEKQSVTRRQHTDLIWKAYEERFNNKPTFTTRQWDAFDKWEAMATLEDTQKLCEVFKMDTSKEFNAKRIIESFPSPLLWCELINWIRNAKTPQQGKEERKVQTPEEYWAKKKAKEMKDA